MFLKSHGFRSFGLRCAAGGGSSKQLLEYNRLRRQNLPGDWHLHPIDDANEVYYVKAYLTETYWTGVLASGINEQCPVVCQSGQ